MVSLSVVVRYGVGEMEVECEIGEVRCGNVEGKMVDRGTLILLIV
jgi:hypothetical protein